MVANKIAAHKVKYVEFLSMLKREKLFKGTITVSLFMYSYFYHISDVFFTSWLHVKGWLMHARKGNCESYLEAIKCTFNAFERWKKFKISISEWWILFLISSCFNSWERKTCGWEKVFNFELLLCVLSLWEKKSFRIILKFIQP